MKRILYWIIAHPWVSVLTTCVLTAVFACGLPRLEIDSSANMLLVEGDPDRAYYDEVRKVFGDDVILSIVVKADSVFRPEVLQAIENLSAEAEILEGVSRVVSLSTVSNIRGQDGILNVDDLVPYVPGADETDVIASIRDNALHNELLHGEVVSKDGTAAAVNLFITDQPQDNRFNEKITTAVQQQIDRELAALGSDSGVEIYQTGVPRLKVDMVRNIRRDMTILLPVSFVVIFAILFALYRSLAAVVIPAVTGALSVVVTLGFMGFAGLDLNPVSLIIPMLLIVIGATEDIHLISEYGLALDRGKSKKAAIRAMAAKGGLAIFLTSLTTVLGFATILINELPVLAEFALAASFGMIVNFVVTILLVPHLLALLPASRGLAWSTSRGKEGSPRRSGLLRTLAFGIARTASRRRGTVALLSVLAGVFCFLASLRVEINTDYLSFFHRDAPVRKSFDDIGERLAGAQSFFVVVDTQESGGLKDPDNFRELAKLSDFVAAKTDKVSGFPNLIRKTHREMNDGQVADENPGTQALVAQYALMVDQDDLVRYVDYEFSRTSLLVRTKMSGSRDIGKLMREIEEFANNNLPPDLKVRITGEMILIAQASDRIGKGILTNLLMLLGAVLVVISVLFWSIKAGLLAMIPNVIPILATFAAMGVLGFELSPGTFSVAMIAFGIAVDDSIHFMVRYHKELKTGCAEKVAIRRSVTKEFRPILASSLALVLGFLVLMVSDFGSIYQFGLLAALSLGAALLCDLFLTPVIFLVSPLITAWDYLRLKIDEQALRGSKLFEGLKLSRIKRVALSGRVENFEPGDDVVVEGGSGTDLFFVLNGRARVIKRTEDGHAEQDLEELSRGSVFGEMAFVTKEPRSATIRAVEPLEVIRIGERTLERILRRHPWIAARIYQNLSRLLSERLRRMTHGG